METSTLREGGGSLGGNHVVGGFEEEEANGGKEDLNATPASASSSFLKILALVFVSRIVVSIQVFVTKTFIFFLEKLVLIFYDIVYILV